MRSPNATALEDKLIRARQKYQNARDEVLGAVEQRRGAISETITDLKVEDESLAKVAEQARQG